MAKEVRRDNKGRILRTVESQRTDGRYLYKCTNALGELVSLYSWKLVSTDKTPKGKCKDISLWEKIDQLQKDLNDGYRPCGKETHGLLYDKKNSLRKNVKHNTVKGRKQFMNLLKKDPLGSMTIDTVKLFDVKKWAMRMNEKGVSLVVDGYSRFLFLNQKRIV